LFSYYLSGIKSDTNLGKPSRGNSEKVTEAAAPSSIKEIQEVQGGQEVPHNGDTIIPKDA
jgi:hypothetical protein